MHPLVQVIETSDETEDEPTVAVRALARCAEPGVDWTAIFFSEDLYDIARAKHLCRTCPVREQCLAGATARREPWGVWGGELLANGRVVAQKRRRGRPPKNRPAEVIVIDGEAVEVVPAIQSA
jgi:WhiB family transcriptional regulator, redox-sensing transcriptional regulator